MALAIEPTAGWGWAEEIGTSVQLRQQVHAAEGDVAPFTTPSVAATDGQLDSARVRLGRPLDVHHRALLAHADGWEYFFNVMHLLGCDELGRAGAGSRSGGADVILDTFFDGGAPVPDLPGRDDLLVIGSNPTEITDLLLLWQIGPVSGGGRPVSWVAHGAEVERFDNCWQLLVSVDTYLLSDLAPRQTSSPATGTHPTRRDRRP